MSDASEMASHRVLKLTIQHGSADPTASQSALRSVSRWWSSRSADEMKTPDDDAAGSWSVRRLTSLLAEAPITLSPALALPNHHPLPP